MAPAWMLLSVVLAGALVPNVLADKPEEPCTILLNGAQRNCCNTTGVCQDSSCVVLGFANSGKSNCPVKSGACDDVVCDWILPDCTAQEHNPNVHCFGWVKCKSGGTECPDYGKLCLEDGSSNNFKICPRSGASTTPVDPTVDPTLDPTDIGATCGVLETQVPSHFLSWNSGDAPKCDIAQTEAIMKDPYGCVRPYANCQFLQCTQPIPTETLAALKTMQC